ncbi:MAG: cyclic nucleotide-binding domain-containing protein [Oscillospiraceae bacterium]|nr:cyclic nucleotide-binding domain-containing protein [Oscillospiraceae bacterium]
MGATREITFQKGGVIIREGDFDANIYKLLSGCAAVYANYGKEGEKLLTELREGDYFGEMAVIEITRRSATVVAAEDQTRVAQVDASDLGGYLSEHRSEINGIARHLSRRLRELTNDYTEVCDTLRELGRLDTSADKVEKTLLDRIKKFARVYLGARREEEETAQPVAHVAAQRFGRELALRGAEYRKGDVIFREGAASDCMYYIYEGRIGIYTGYGTENQKLLTELTPEMFFGEMGLFEGRLRTATAVALLDDTFVELIYEKDLDTIFDKSPKMALMVLQHLSNRLRNLTSDYLKACRTLADAERELDARKPALTKEMLARAQYLNQLMLAPEVLY